MWDRDVSAVKIQDATGISTTTISNIIHGKQTNLRLDTIEKLCVFLECELTDLLELKK